MFGVKNLRQDLADGRLEVFVFLRKRLEEPFVDMQQVQQAVVAHHRLEEIKNIQYNSGSISDF